MEALTQREIAVEIVEEAFRERKRVAIPEMVELGRERGVSRRLLTNVARERGIYTVHNGPLPGFWERAE